MVTELGSLVACLYFDEDADARLAEALLQRSYDVETTVAAGLLEASDEEQLAYAVSQQRALVTHNIKHFPIRRPIYLLLLRAPAPPTSFVRIVPDFGRERNHPHHIAFSPRRGYNPNEN